MYSFYRCEESKNVEELLFLLMKKARKERLSVSVCFANRTNFEDFSRKIWYSGQVLAHGLPEDGFLDLQPIVFDLVLHKKDVAIILFSAIQAGFVKFSEILNYSKVLFIDDLATNDRSVFEADFFVEIRNFAVKNHEKIRFWKFSRSKSNVAWENIDLNQFFIGF